MIKTFKGKGRKRMKYSIEKVKFVGCIFSTNLYDVVQEKRK